MQTIVCGRWNKHSSDHSETKNLRKTRRDVDAGKAQASQLRECEDAVTALVLGELEKAGVSMCGDGSIRRDSIYDVARDIKGCSGFTRLTRIPKNKSFSSSAGGEAPPFF